MSAYIVSHDCIARVVFALRSAQPERVIDGDLLGMMLLEMNRRACVALYGDNNVEAITPFRYVTPPGEPHLIVHVYKSLRCYLYQCSEGDVPDQPLYLKLDALAGAMADTLGHDRTADRWLRPDVKAVYDAFEWG
jgi:hypothetical protein